MFERTYQQEAAPPCEVGDRIELRHMGNDPDPIPTGTRGTVNRVCKTKFPGRPPEWQIGVNWDNGRTLSLVWPEDTFLRLPA